MRRLLLISGVVALVRASDLGGSVRHVFLLLFCDIVLGKPFGIESIPIRFLVVNFYSVLIYASGRLLRGGDFFLALSPPFGHLA